jgi:hypothetical protein
MGFASIGGAQHGCDIANLRHGPKVDVKSPMSTADRIRLAQACKLWIQSRTKADRIGDPRRIHFLFSQALLEIDLGGLPSRAAA